MGCDGLVSWILVKLDRFISFFVYSVQRSVWERNPASRHHLRPEGRKRFQRCTSQRVCTSGQTGGGAAVRDGRVHAAVVHHGVERGGKRAEASEEEHRDPRH